MAPTEDKATVDAQGRGRAEGIDPADQWVFDPDTGSYVLRLDPAQDPAPSSEPDPGPRAGGRRRRAAPESGHRAEDSPGHRAGDAEGTGRRGETVPEQRGGRRRAAGAAAADRTQGSTSRRKPKPKKSKTKKALVWGGGTMAFLLVGTAVAGYVIYQKLNGNITKVDVGRDDSAVTDGPANILIIGTDKRDGKGNSGYGDAGSVGHADTTLLFHVAADRSNATVLSIPRDLITDIPKCPTKQEDGSFKDIPGEQKVRFNTSLGQEKRDPGCTMRTVEKLVGVRVNHFMMADFNAVKDLSSAVGGVDVCLGKDINDPKSHLNLSKGQHTIKGEEALAFVRTRHAVGFGGDLDRIKLQQQFLSSMIRKVKSNGTLTSPKKMWTLGNAATKALTVDTGIGSIKKLTDLARNLSKVNEKNITFTTLPVIDNPAEPVGHKATVVADPSKAPDLLSMIKDDVSLTEVKKKEKAAKDKQAAKLKGTKADPADVRVKVLNGSEQFGAAQTTVDWMQNQEGMLRSSNGGNAPGKLSKTTLEYAPNQADQARRLADSMGLPGSALKEGTEDAEPMAEMTLTLGADFKGAGKPISGPTKAPEGIQKVEADDKSVCAK